MISQSKWEWFGNAGHFICASRCQFHLCTLVGKYLISSVGEMVNQHGVWEDIGYKRKFEAFVFLAGKRCNEKGCKCGMPTFKGGEIDVLMANDRKKANENHLKLCLKYARMQ